MAQKDNTWTITIDKGYQGYAPLAFANQLTEHGGAGNASSMQNVDCLTDVITQGPALANLTAGTQAGAITELVNFIMDTAVAADVSYAVSTTKLHKISSTAVTNAGIWPHAITGCTNGESIQVIKGNLYYFYNKSGGADVGKYDLNVTFTDGWASGLGGGTFINAPHPSAAKEDLIVWGNGQYVGLYVISTNTINTTKLDFGLGAVVSDVLYNAGYWYIAVNSGITGTNRTTSQIYLWDGSALTSSLSDELAVGNQRIGFIYVIGGVCYAAYQDLTYTGFIIGYVAGKALKPLCRYNGVLPTFNQKTLYKNNIAFVSSGLVYTAGAFVDTLPYQLSQHADGGYTTCGAIAAPFGTPMVASTDGATNFRLAQFSGYDTACSWKNIITSLVGGLNLGYIDDVTVLTKALGAGAVCNLTIEANQAVTTSVAQAISTTGRTRHYFTNLGLSAIEDFRVALDWSVGSAVNPCAIRRIIVRGHYAEK